MIEALCLLASFLKFGFKDRTELALENLALRQQLAILKRNQPQTRLKRKSFFDPEFSANRANVFGIPLISN
jgi:hypothetical protein